MSATLLAAVNDAWNANAALAAALTLYNDEPPEGTALPYAVVTGVREKINWASFEGGKEYEGRARIVIPGSGTAAVEALVQQAKAVLETDGTILIDNRVVLGVLMEVYDVQLDKIRSTVARRVTTGTLSLFVWSQG
jgi:nucleotide-binding universal stress UspA family protein